MPVKIPVSYVPRAYVEYDAEARQILGQPLTLSDGFRVPPLTPARLIALEIVSSPFFLHPFECDALDAAAAIVLISCDRKLVEELTDDRSASADPSAARDAQATAAVEGSPSSPRGLSAYPKLSEAAAIWLSAHGDAMLADYQRLVDWILDVPFYGLAMIPGDPPPPREFWFDGTFAGGVVAAAAKVLATPVDAVFWGTPLCLIGHALAQHAAAYGVKHVERPPDKAVLHRLMQEAAAREKAGQLHPWQYEDPLDYPLTDTQANAAPALIGLFARMRAEYERNGRKPLDPAAFPYDTGTQAVQAPAQALDGAVGSASRAADGSADAEQAAEPIGPVSPASACEPVLSVSGAGTAAGTLTISMCASGAERTAAVEGLPSRPCGASTEKESMSVYV